MPPADDHLRVTDEQIAAMDVRTLADLRKRATHRAVELEMRPLDALRKEYDDLLEKIGEIVGRYDLTAESFIRADHDEIFQYLLGLATHGRKPRRRTAKNKRQEKSNIVLPRYRHPVTGQVWTGRGAKPKWVEAYLEEDPNHTMADLRVSLDE